jgi:hypothetical protein
MCGLLLGPQRLYQNFLLLNGIHAQTVLEKKASSAIGACQLPMRDRETDRRTVEAEDLPASTACPRGAVLRPIRARCRCPTCSWSRTATGHIGCGRSRPSCSAPASTWTAPARSTAAGPSCRRRRPCAGSPPWWSRRAAGEEIVRLGAATGLVVRRW